MSKTDQVADNTTTASEEGAAPSTDSTASVTEPEATLVLSWSDIEGYIGILESIGFTVTRGSANRVSGASNGRDTGPKADPDAVHAFFGSLHMSNREIAQVLGIGASVISTVQNPNGDRWSQAIFDERKPVLLAARAAKYPGVIFPDMVSEETPKAD